MRVLGLAMISTMVRGLSSVPLAATGIAPARYDWSRTAEVALFNSAGLPAESFQTDK
jgi:hypothetical protein